MRLSLSFIYLTLSSSLVTASYFDLNFNKLQSVDSTQSTSIEALLARHAGLTKRDLSTVIDDTEIVGEDVGTAADYTADGAVDSYKDTKLAYNDVASDATEVESYGSRFTKIFKKRYIWSGTVINDNSTNSDLPNPDKNENLLNGGSSIITTPTESLVDPVATSAPGALVASAQIIDAAVLASDTSLDNSFKLSEADADALLLAESREIKKRYVWSNQILQDGDITGPAPGMNENLLSSGTTIDLATPTAQLSAPSFPPRPAMMDASPTSVPIPSPSTVVDSAAPPAPLISSAPVAVLRPSLIAAVVAVPLSPSATSQTTITSTATTTMFATSTLRMITHKSAAPFKGHKVMAANRRKFVRGNGDTLNEDDSLEMQL